MSRSDHMSRQELHQPDVIEHWLYIIVQYVYKNRSLFTAAAGALVVLGLVAIAGAQYYESEQVTQSERFYHTQKAVSHADLATGSENNPAIQALKQFLKDYPDTANGVLAQMVLGNVYVTQKQWTPAEQAYKAVAQHSQATPSLINAAKLSLATLYENQQQWDAAQKILDEITEKTWQDLRWRTLARLSLSKGDVAAAKTHLQQLIQNVPDSTFKQEAETLLSTLN